LQGDIIDVFKIIHNIYDATVSPHLPFNSRANTGGSSYKLLNQTFHYDLQKHSFSACIVNIWNNLPNSVINAGMVNAFKARLDKFWLHEAVKFGFIADLTGSRN